MKLFVFDVDGTLLTWTGRFRKRTISAMNLILKNGDAVAIASGRNFCGIKQYLDKLIEGKKFVISANGAGTYDNDGNIIDFCGLHFKDFREFHEKFGEEIYKRGGSFYGYSLKEVIYYKMSHNTKMESVCNNNAPLRSLVTSPLKDEDEILKIMVSLEQDKLNDLDFSEEKKKFNAVDSSTRYHEYVNKKTDKSRGVEAVRKYLNIDIDDCLCFGDQMNDFQMIKNYHGVAMGNAIEEVKSVAKEITGDVKDDGVAQFLEKYYKN